MLIMDFLEKKNWNTNIKVKTKMYFLKAPEILSFIENTDETINFFQKFYSYKYNMKKKLFLDLKYCKKIDLSSAVLITLFLVLYIVEDTVNDSLKLKKWYISEPDKKVEEVLITNSLFKYLMFGKGEKDIEQSIEKLDLEGLRLIIGGKSQIELMRFIFNNEYLRREDDDIMILDVLKDNCTYISQVISNSQKTNGKSLNYLGHNQINSFVGEILTNCKEHLGNEFSQYYISGLFRKSTKEINLAFISFGDTISEGLNNNSKDIKESIRTLKEVYLKENKKFNKEFTEEMLETLYSLQFTISREYEKESSKKRGTGTIKMLDFFFSLKKEKGITPIFTIISGHTKIQLDISDKKYYNKKNGILIFNEEKNFFKKQNSKNIKSLENFFPGTIITINFKLDETWLEENENVNS